MAQETVEKEYDVIVIGSGRGLKVAYKALKDGYRVALVDKGPAGGTCVNVGCIPSKMLIAVADRAMELREASKFGIDAQLRGFDFPKIMGQMRDYVNPITSKTHDALKGNEDLDYYHGAGTFTGDYMLDADGAMIKGKKIFIASGARPSIPPIKGLDNVDYLTNETVLRLDTLPRSMIIVGGGYIGVEFAHFFSALGTAVTIIQRSERLVPGEEPEISETLEESLARRTAIYTEAELTGVSHRDGQYSVVCLKKNVDDELTLTAEHLLIATGRLPNTDTLAVEKTGVKTDKRGYIIVNEYMETSKANIWAFGDVIGRAMFTHEGNEEASVAWHNAANDEKRAMDYSYAPHAVFTWPPIASVGMRENEAKQDHGIQVGIKKFADVVKGAALRDEHSFAKVIVDKQTEKILGFHIIGPYAPLLIQEIVAIMAAGGETSLLAKSTHIHPALAEVIQGTIYTLS